MKTKLDAPAETEGSDSGLPGRRNGRRWVWGSSLVVLAILAGWFLVRSDGTGTPDVALAEMSFTEVIVTDLFEETEYDATLGRPAGDSLIAAAQGTVTWLPAVGQTVTQGEPIFAIDEKPVILLFGATPMYRTISRSATDTTVSARITGTITAVPEPGAVIEQGDVLFEIDGNPVIALYGDTPAYRSMFDAATNLTGPDIGQLERALAALGFVEDGEITVDDEFTSATAAVVEEWQAAIGAIEDGSVDLGEVVFIAGPTEVSSVSVSVGASIGSGQPVISLADSEPMTGPDVAQLETALKSLGFDGQGAMVADDEFTSETSRAVKDFETVYGLNVDGRLSREEVLFVNEGVRISNSLVSLGGIVNQGTPVLAVTGERTIVTLKLPAADQGTLEVNMSVSVELPDRSEVAGSVTSVATVATLSGNETVFEVEISLEDPTLAAGLDEAPVTVKVVTDSVEGVMAVPVSALLALAEGGYALELDAGNGQTRLVAVEPGFFADGLVEVVSNGLQPGDLVVIP